MFPRLAALNAPLLANVEFRLFLRVPFFLPPGACKKKGVGVAQEGSFGEMKGVTSGAFFFRALRGPWWTCEHSLS